MRRVVISVVLTAALALPAGAGARSTPYIGSPVTVGLKVHKPQLKLVVVDPNLPLQCDEGKTKSIQAGEQWNSAPFPKVKKSGKFHIEFKEVILFQILDDGGYVVSQHRAPFFIDVTGKFKHNYQKVSGTLTMHGSSNGPASPPYYQEPEYHNCTSGTLYWSAHKSG